MSGQIKLHVVTTGARDSAALEDLDAWLRGERDLAGRVALSRPAPRPGELGSVADALIVAVGAQGVLTVLAGSLRAWLSQPKRSHLRVRIATGRDTYIELDADRVRSADLEGLLGQALGAAVADEAVADKAITGTAVEAPALEPAPSEPAP